MQTGSKKEGGSWSGYSGADCTCDGKKYKAVDITFPESAQLHAPALQMPLAGAASAMRPFSEARRRFMNILDEMDRDLLV
jgi:hypothetical protein